jgi:hypothetical protein
MKAFVALAIAASASAVAVKKDTEITAGIFYGITQEEGLTELSSCMHDSDRFVDEIVKGVEMIIEHDLRSIIAGTRSIARAVHSLPSYLDECEHSAEDIHTLEAWSHIFLEPANLVQTIAANAINNPARVSFEVLKARRQYKDGQWFDFGDDVGTLLALLTTPVPADQLQAMIDQE